MKYILLLMILLISACSSVDRVYLPAGVTVSRHYEGW